jgi:hypothetical protein
MHDLEEFTILVQNTLQSLGRSINDICSEIISRFCKNALTLMIVEYVPLARELHKQASSELRCFIIYN